MSVTYRAKTKKRKKKHGFLKRQKTKGGKRVVKRRRAKGRKKLSV
jgi:large subunit ribosomal protein L34